MIVGIVLAVVGFVGLVMAGIVAAIMVPNFMKARAASQYTACKSNCRNIGTALEMYASDFKGQFPPSLDYVTPNYLRSIPTCPSAKKDTYSESYTSTIRDLKTGTLDSYSFFCQGEYHKIVSNTRDCPRYDSEYGLSAP
jgi:type II secretory pathway pseudopilin PulG